MLLDGVRSPFDAEAEMVKTVGPRDVENNEEQEAAPEADEPAVEAEGAEEEEDDEAALDPSDEPAEEVAMDESQVP